MVMVERSAAEDSAGIVEYTFHHIAQRGGGIGVYAELYAVPRPVTAHRHDFHEVAFAMTGSGQHEDEGGRLPILSGDVWLIAPGQWHAYPLVGGTLEIFNLLIAPRFLAAHAPTLDLAYPRSTLSAAGLAMAGGYLRLSPQGRGHIHPLLATLARELRAPPGGGQEAICVGLTLQVLGLLDRYGVGEAAGSPGALAARPDPGLLAAVRHIEDCYAEEITLDDLARHSGYAPTYLTRKFHQRLGVPPSDYLLQVRLHHACTLLETTDLSVTTIAHQVGFGDSRYFATRFGRALSMTPTAFRCAARDRITNKPG